MPSYVNPKKATAFVFYTGLVSQADTKLLKANPTLDAADFRVSIDGGTFNPLGTTPTVVPASGRSVKISLSSGEMTGDNIVVTCVDAAGAEWCDRLVNIQTASNQIDDLPAAVWTVATSGLTGAGTIGKRLADNVDIATSAVAAAVWGVLTSTLTTASTIGKLMVDRWNDYTTTRAGKLDTIDTIVAKTNLIPAVPATEGTAASAASSAASAATAAAGAQTAANTAASAATAASVAATAAQVSAAAAAADAAIVKNKTGPSGSNI